MQLVTIADLERPEHEISPLISNAQKLGEMWLEFLKQDTSPHEYVVRDGGEKDRGGGIHSSEMSKCMLKLVYSIMGIERRPDADKTDPNMKLRFRTGTAIHGMVQSDFRRMAEWYTANNAHLGWSLSFEAELKVKTDLQEVAKAWDINSSCDGAFTFWRWDGAAWVAYLRVGVEIKTSSAPSYESRKKPEPDHMEQTCLYQACLDLPLMWVLYYNKSNSNFTTPYSPWLFKFDKHKWERELEMRFAKAHHMAEQRQLPERTEGKHCGWCPFAYACQPKVLNRMSYSNGAPAVSTGMLMRRP
jgi:CRISPR/Cas system-associated exonuclease Cas4 (RecB family)